MGSQTFVGTASLKVRRLFLPTNRRDAKLRILCILRLKQYRLLLTSIGVPTSKPIKAYDNNESVVHSVRYHHITPRSRHVDIPMCYLYHEHDNGLFETKYVPSRIQFSNMGNKTDSVPNLM